MSNALKIFCYTCLLGILLPTLLFAQKELKKYDRVRYAGVGYTPLGFGEVNRQLLTQKQAQKISRRIDRIQKDYGAIVVFVSLLAEEVKDRENGLLGGLFTHYLGEDPRAARNHVTILFSEEDGKSWIHYGSDNEPDFTAHTQKLTQLFASKYRKPKAYHPIRRLLGKIDRIYAGLTPERRNVLHHPQLSAKEWVDLSRAEMEVAGDYNAAAQHLGNALKLDSANAEAHKLLGYASMELQDWDAAARALTTSWSLEADFATAIGRLTLHYLRNEPSEMEKWRERARRFSPDFEEKIHEAAHYASKGYFPGNSARKVFNELFKEEIQQSKSEKMREAEAY